ncbi:probable membrane-associated kinase regulator 5 [Juglans regia]|uniref:Probable membrane-associated kinase regulator 5 n=2 Tax=Juglans regia TaxID=51240 RepID=A0A2I4GTV7_JUGRE|nr:probable membrane-associated kinase regulator 5 [Juglans regia]
MEALNFIKFWRSTGTYTFNDHASPNPLVVKEDELEEEEEDSFFDLEISVSDFDSQNTKTNDDPETSKDKENVTRLDSAKHNHNPAQNPGLNFSEPTLSLFPNDLISRRKILPIEPRDTKPHSPIALLKSAPRFQVLPFKKPKSKLMPTPRTGKTESKSSSIHTQKQKKQDNNAFFTVKLKDEETPNSSLFTRANSLRKSESKLQDHKISEDSKTERFSKEIIQKYLNLIKPLYVKVSKRYSEKLQFPEVLPPSASPSSSPATIPFPKKHLRKSKSASASIGVTQPVSRRDDSLWEQHDGIQSAILHCKRSLNSSRESSLSRSIGGSLHEKSRDSFSKDSSLLSRFTSEPSDEKSVEN